MINGQLIPVALKGRVVNLTATGSVDIGAGAIAGVVINSHTGGTLKLWDSLSATGTVLFETITFGATERSIDFMGASFGVGCFATIGGTANLSFIINE